eukprot:2457311-Rhodomonas_salina.1
MRTQRLQKGQKLPGGEACVTYVIEGQAAAVDSEGRVQEVFDVGDVHGEEALLGFPTSPLVATTSSLLVLRLAKDRLQELRGTDPDNFDRFEAQMRLHRAWYFGDGHGEGKSLSAEEVQELSESLCSLARQDDGETIQRQLFNKGHLAGVGDPA